MALLALLLALLEVVVVRVALPLLLLLLLLLLAVVVLLLLVGVRASLPPPATSSMQALGGSRGLRAGWSRAAAAGAAAVSIKCSRSRTDSPHAPGGEPAPPGGKHEGELPSALMHGELGARGGVGGVPLPVLASSSGAGEHKDANPCGEGGPAEPEAPPEHDDSADVEDALEASTFGTTDDTGTVDDDDDAGGPTVGDWQDDDDAADWSRVALDEATLDSELGRAPADSALEDEDDEVRADAAAEDDAREAGRGAEAPGSRGSDG